MNTSSNRSSGSSQKSPKRNEKGQFSSSSRPGTSASVSDQKKKSSGDRR